MRMAPYRVRGEGLPDKIFQYVRENPGCTGREIRQSLGEHNTKSVATTMHRLQVDKKLIENRGGQGTSGRWYPVNLESEIPMYYEAERILEEMFKLPSGRSRTAYLAEQLQSLTNQPTLF
jgi:predicted transcriptional regulator